MICTGAMGSILVVVWLLMLPLGTPMQPSATQPCVVERVVDGDTIRCRGNVRVRLLLIDSPERSQRPFGPEAAAALQRLLPNGSLALLELDVQPRDRYGRTLAYVYNSDGLMANEEMLRAGYAVVLVYPPNVRYVDRFRAASAEALQARRGLWAGSAFECLPKDHRAGRC
jgi:micrococcal nuclease